MYFNRRYSRSGHLFAGRYKARLVEGGDCLLRLTRYIHLNPVKVQGRRNLPAAEQAAYLAEYRWSSYRGYIGLEPQLPWVKNEALRAFPASVPGAAAENYRVYVEEMLDDEDEVILGARNRLSKAIGSEKFCRHVDAQHREAMRGALRPIDIAARRAECGVPVERITAEVLKMYELDERELFRRGNREAKDMWLKLALDEGGLGQRDVGVRFGHADGTTVSRRLAEIAVALASDRNLRRRYEDVRRRIANSSA
jgi:hypothetical protein